MQQLNIFLGSGKALRLILDDLPTPKARSNALVQVMNSVNDPTRNVRYKVDTNGVFKKHLTNSFKDGKAHHFMVSDASAYRFETDEEKFSAFGNFNDPKNAGYLIQLFDFFLK